MHQPTTEITTKQVARLTFTLGLSYPKRKEEAAYCAMSPPPPPSPLSGAPAPATTDLCCRICFDDDSRANLVRPCACAGSIAYVHPHCLSEWIARTESVESRSLCPQCKAPYDILPGPSAQRRRRARYLLTGLDVVGCALFVATMLPWYTRCMWDGGWMPWQPEVLTFFSQFNHPLYVSCSRIIKAAHETKLVGLD